MKLLTQGLGWYGKLYNPHGPPRAPNSGATSIGASTYIDNLLEHHFGRNRLAEMYRKANKDVHMLVPSLNELDILGVEVGKQFLNYYGQFLDVIERYKENQLLDQATINKLKEEIMKVKRLERAARIKKEDIGIDALAELHS